jgi:hypothetical protein
MHDPKEFRDLARRCRERAKCSMEPDVIEQLRRWAIELADDADEIERDLPEPGSASVVRIRGTGRMDDDPPAEDGTDASRQRFTRIANSRKGTND